MKKRAAAIISSLLVLGCAYPVFAAPKNVYTDADSGFAVQRRLKMFTQTLIPALRCKL